MKAIKAGCEPRTDSTQADFISAELSGQKGQLMLHQLMYFLAFVCYLTQFDGR